MDAFGKRILTAGLIVLSSVIISTVFADAEFQPPLTPGRKAFGRAGELVLRGCVLKKNGEFLAALKCHLSANSILKEEGTQLEQLTVNLLIADSAIKLKEFGIAKQSLDTIDKIESDEVQIPFSQRIERLQLNGILKAKTRDFDSALVDFQTALSIVESTDERSLGRPRVEFLIQLSSSLRANGFPKLAVEKYRRIIGGRASNSIKTEAQLGLASCYLKLGNGEELLKFCHKIAAANSEMPVNAKVLILSLIGHGLTANQRSFEKSYQQIVRRIDAIASADTTTIHLGVARALQRFNDERAIHHYKIVVEGLRQHESPRIRINDVLCELVQAQLSHNQFGKAKKVLKELSLFDEPATRAKFMHLSSKIALANRNESEFIQLVNDSISIYRNLESTESPHLVRALLSRANSEHRAVEPIKEAIELITPIRRLEPELALSTYSYAHAFYEKVGRTHEAKKTLKDAYEFYCEYYLSEDTSLRDFEQHPYWLRGRIKRCGKTK